MKTRCARVRYRVLTPLAAAAILVSACGSGSTTSQATTSQPPAPVTTQAQTPAASAQPAPPATAVAPQAAAPSALVQEHETGVEVTLVELRRTSGDSVTLKWRYRNGTSQAVKLAKGGSSWSDPYRLTWGAYLIDTVNKKKYLVITDAEGRPLTSKHGDWQGVTLEPGQAINAWAKLPAPPADVEKVSVTIEGVPPFEDVPIVK